VFAGDLVEEGAPPAFEDAFPVDWPTTLGRLHALARGPVVPGHGAVVDAAYVGAQREELLAVLAALRAGRPEDGPYDAATLRVASSRLPP
jgi:glyoxylase-like metal-dependent hydrolase (beta-lactamase superfamily II)